MSQASEVGRRRWRGATAPALAVVIALFGVISTVGCAAVVREEIVGVSITGLDHLAEHVSIQNFWVDGTLGHQAGKGGRQVCCASIPAQSRSGQTVHIRWAVTNWRDKVYSMHEREVPVERYDEVGGLYVHFLRDGAVRVLSTNHYPEKPGYPGPSYSTVLRKRPWSDYRPLPGEPEFREVANAMEDHKK